MKRIGWMACFSIVLIGCVSQEKLRASREFYYQPVAEQLRTFRNHSMADQLDLFFFGNQVHHPPATYLAKCFALNGAAGVKLLQAQLSDRTDDLTVRDVIALLAAMDAMHRYNVHGDKELLAQAAQRVDQMRDSYWRQIAQDDLTGIRKQSSAFSGDGSECRN